MGSIVTQVIDQLQAHQIHADEAYPGKRSPALELAVAAVRLGKVDRSVRTTTVLVTIMGPAKSGGGFCESTALKAVTVLQNMGGTCKKDVCRFDEMADVFYIEIEVEFFGTATADNWSAGPGYSVTLGIQSVSGCSEKSTRKLLPSPTPSGSLHWRSFCRPMQQNLPIRRNRLHFLSAAAAATKF